MTALEVQTPTNLITSAARGLPLHRIEKLANELEPERVVMRIQRRIDATIDELSALVRQPPTAANEARYDRLMAELQDLEEKQAEEMGAYFDSHRPLPEGAGYAAIRAAQALLKRHARSSRSHRTQPRTPKKTP